MIARVWVKLPRVESYVTWIPIALETVAGIATIEEVRVVGSQMRKMLLGKIVLNREARRPPHAVTCTTVNALPRKFFT